MEITNGCLDCEDLNSLTDLFFKLKKIAEFDAAVCSCVKPSRLPASIDKAVRPLNYRYPENLMNMWRLNRCYKIDFPVQAILSSLDLLDSSGPIKRFSNSKTLNIVIPQSNGNRLSSGWVYGAYEKCCSRWLLFVFGCRSHLDEPRFGIAIELAVPHLLNAFRSFRYLCPARPFHLTPIFAFRKHPKQIMN